jgi:hypothetical protein
VNDAAPKIGLDASVKATEGLLSIFFLRVKATERSLSILFLISIVARWLFCNGLQLLASFNRLKKLLSLLLARISFGEEFSTDF